MNKDCVRPQVRTCCINPQRLRGATGPTGPAGLPGPIGATGSTGPTGPTGPYELPIYGGVYNNVLSVLSIGIVQSQVPMTGEMPSNGVTIDSPSIIIDEEGIYEINWFLNGYANINTTLALAIRRNGESLATASQIRFVVPDESNIFTGSIIIALNNGDIIDMALSANSGMTVSLPQATNTLLTVKKIG